MKLWKQYMKSEMKCMLKKFPLLILGNLLVFSFLAGILSISWKSSRHADGENSIVVGIVAKEDEPFIDWMVAAVSGMENIKDAFRFRRVSKQEADHKLESGEIAVAFLVPSDYVASVINGENKHVTIRSGKGQATIVNFLLRELSHAASDFILDTEAGIYTMQEYYKKQGLPNLRKDEMELNLRYIKEIVELGKGIQAEEIPTEKAYPLPEQYLVSALVLFLLFWGLTCSQILIPPNKAFQNQLALFGVGSGKQCLARGIAFFTVACANYLVFFGIVSILLYAAHFPLQDTVCSNMAGVWKFAFCLIPVLLFSAAYIQMAYEAAGDAMGGVLFLFFSIFGMGLCSGCFYPFHSLPGAIQAIAPAIPVWQARHYALAVLNRTFDRTAFFALVFWIFLSWLIIAGKRSLAH